MKETREIMSHLCVPMGLALPLVAALLIAGCDDSEALHEVELEQYIEQDEEWSEGNAEDDIHQVDDELGANESGLAGADDVSSAASQLTTKPKLWAPYPAGVAYRCTQGPFETFSHNASNTKYAIDFDTPNDGSPKPIVAALAGRVDYVLTGCQVNDQKCGGGFGNHVKLSHGGNYYTVYAHLSSVAVSTGDRIGRGQRLGYEGNTGKSEGDHLHFSLHQGNATMLPVVNSVSYWLRNADLTEGGGFSDRLATDHECGLVEGHFYESDNACAWNYDTPNTAKLITNNTTYRGETCAVGDIDYFSLKGKSGAFTAKIESTDESIFDCSCAILDEDENPLTVGGPEGYVRNDSYNGSEGCACSMSNASAGKTYFLKIYTQMPGAYLFHKQLP